MRYNQEGVPMKEDSKLMTMIYTFALGVVITLFISFGISAFYVAPAFPEYPKILENYSEEQTEEQKAAQKEYDQQMERHQEKDKTYSRNVSAIVLSSSVILMFVSLVLAKKIRVLADGVMIGGLLLLGYSVIRSLTAESSKYAFVAITIGLIAVLFLGYFRFVRGTSHFTK